MRKEFHGHFPLGDDVLRRLMQEATFVFDTNVLLNLYRYGETLREDYFKLMEKIGDRVEVPHQIACEFFDNRIGVIGERNGIGEKLRDELTSLHNKTRGAIEPLKRHAPIDIPRLLASIDAAFTQASEETGELPPPIDPMRDAILDRLANLLEGKIRSEPSKEQTTEVEKWADTHFKRLIPPGFKDEDKSGPKKYGDAKIWWDILEIGKSTQKPVIFVTDDLKEDWWLVPKRGQTLGPHPYLRQEFLRETGQDFYMYPADKFLQYAGETFNSSVDKTSVSEAREFRERRMFIGVDNSKLTKIVRQASETRRELRRAEIHLSRLKSITPGGKNNDEEIEAAKVAQEDYIDELRSTLHSIQAAMDVHRSTQSILFDESDALQFSGDPAYRTALVQEYDELGEEDYQPVGDQIVLELLPDEIHELKHSVHRVVLLPRLGGRYRLIAG